MVLQSLYSEHSIGGVIDRQQNMLFRKSESGLGRQTIYVYLHHQKIILAHRQLCILSSLHYSMGKPRRHTNRHQKEKRSLTFFVVKRERSSTIFFVALKGPNTGLSCKIFPCSERTSTLMDPLTLALINKYLPLKVRSSVIK